MADDYNVTLPTGTNVTALAEGGDSEEVSTTIKDIIMKGFYITIASLGILGNSVVLVVLLGLTKMRKRMTSAFIINQSIIDALTAVFLLLTTVLPSDGRVYKSVADDLYCRLWVTRLPLWLCLHCSTYNLVALTIERYLSVVHPIHHKTSFSRLKALLMICGTWIFAAIYDVGGTIPIAYAMDGACMLYMYKSTSAMKGVGIMGACVNYFIPITILIYCYSRMAYSLRSKVSPNADGETQNRQISTAKARAKMNVIKTLAVVSTAFILCVSWNQWFFFLFNLGMFDFRALNSNYYHFSVVAMFANCCVNPIIYTAQYEEFQKGLKKVFFLKKNGLISSQTGDMNSTITSHM